MTLTARDVMRTNVRTVRADTRLTDLDRALSSEKHSGMPVMDAKHRLIGIVTRTDIVRKLAAEWSQLEYQTESQRELFGYREAASDESEAVGARVGMRLADTTVESLMSHSPITVAPEAPVQQVAQTLIDNGIHRVPVVDERERLAGIVTMTDLIRLLAESRVEVIPPSAAAQDE